MGLDKKELSKSITIMLIFWKKANISVADSKAFALCVLDVSCIFHHG